MAIMTRLSRLLASDVHAVLERMEEPEIVLRHSIREMEESLQARALDLQREQHRLQRLERRRDDARHRIRELDAQLDASIAADRLDTARSTVRRKLEVQGEESALSVEIEDTAQRIGATQEGLERRAEELESLRQKAQLLGECSPSPPTCPVPPEGHRRIDEQAVEAALLVELERRSAS